MCVFPSKPVSALLLQAFIYERARAFADLPSIYCRRSVDDIDITEVHIGLQAFQAHRAYGWPKLHAAEQSCLAQELQVEIADWHQIKRIRPTSHMRRTALPDLSVDKVTFLHLCVCCIALVAKRLNSKIMRFQDMVCRLYTKSQKCQKPKVKIQVAHTLLSIAGSTKHFPQKDGRHSSGTFALKQYSSRCYSPPALRLHCKFKVCKQPSG